MARPFWSGHIQISLVSFGIEMFPATEAKGEIHFHQLSRKTGERIRHQNVSTDENPVDKDDIVKGYEYTKGEYVIIEPEDIDNLRIPSRNILDITQFVSPDELDPMFYEKPYYLVPENPSQAEAFAVVRKALQSTNKVGLGKIAFGGREHLMGIAAPSDESQLGLMGYILRYPDELRDSTEYFSSIKSVKIEADQLSLAQELIKRKTSKFDPTRYTDEYETALRAMVEAKIHHTAPEAEAAAQKSPKVVNLMDALRKSVSGDSATSSAPAKRKSAKPAEVAVMKSTKPAKSAKSKTLTKRRSA